MVVMPEKMNFVIESITRNFNNEREMYEQEIGNINGNLQGMLEDIIEQMMKLKNNLF